MESIKWQCLSKIHKPMQKIHLYLIVSDNWDEFSLPAPTNEILLLARVSVLSFAHGILGEVRL